MIGKVALLATLPLVDAHTGRILAAMVVVSVLSSHAPSAIRYFVLVGRGRLRGAETKG